MVIAAWLHDYLEDCIKPEEWDAARKFLVDEFGEEVADIVWCVTNEPGKNRKERHLATYPKIRSNGLAVFLKLCDRISNVEAGGKTGMYFKEHAEFKMAVYTVYQMQRVETMPVKITSVQNAPKHYDWARLVVSTMMGKKRIQFAGRDKHLILGFEDTEIEGEKDAPQPWHLQRAFQWLGEHNASLEDNLLFHCHAGISRSTAMAWSTLVWLKVPIEDAFQMVVAGADAQIWPNLLVIENADMVLGLNGEFLKFAKEMDQKIQDERRFRIYGSLQ